MRTLRYWIRFSIAFISRFKATLLMGVGIGLLLFLILSALMPKLVSSKKEYLGMPGRYHIQNLPQEILTMIGQGLTSTSPSGEVEAQLAESWEIKEDGKLWIFHLKSGLKWHDGTEVSSQSLQYSFEDVHIERPDKSTISFRLNNAFSPFLSVVSRPTFKKGLLGTGEWKVQQISLAGEFVEELSLIHNDGRQRVIKFYPTEERAKDAYKLGEVDELTNIIDPSPFDSWNTAKVIAQQNKRRYVAIFFNTSIAPFTDNKSLRQALSYAINKQQLSGERSISPTNPDSWAFNPHVKTYDYNVERAAELIGKNPPEIKLSVTPFLLEDAEKIAKDWEAVGIKTQVQVVNLLPGDYQAFLGIHESPDDPDQYAFWHSSQKDTSNISRFSNPRIDKLLENGRLETDREERKKIYFDFQRFLLEDAPAIFLYHPSTFDIIRI